MIPRYSLPEMAALFTDEARLEMWLEVELLAVEGWAAGGHVPAAAAAAVRARAPKVTPELVAAVNERERVTDHDVAAFVDVVQDAIGPPEGSWVHYGLTSSDVVDTALCATLDPRRRPAARRLGGAGVGAEGPGPRVHGHAHGRAHPRHARRAHHLRGQAGPVVPAGRPGPAAACAAARAGLAVGKLSGAVGTYSNIDPAVEAYVCGALGLTPVPATQVIARDRHAELLWACASVGATVEMIGTEIRHLARTEVGEVEEAFGAGQKGSSAMPHKRNPILSERLSGLARVLRGYLGAGLEDVALWHERDISHSSVGARHPPRRLSPDLLRAAPRRRARRTNLVVHTERMRANVVEGSFGLVFSQPVLLALVESGMDRDAAYRVVQRDARPSWEERPVAAGSVLEDDPEVTLDAAALDEAFSLERAAAARVDGSPMPYQEVEG